MRIDKNSKVTMPVWLISALISVLLAAGTTWGIISASTATFEERTIRNASDIKSLDMDKVDKEVFQTVLKRLDEIAASQTSMIKKLDDHLTK